MTVARWAIRHHGFVHHVGAEMIQAGLQHVRAAPAYEGALVLIVCRPAVGQRRVLQVAELSLEEGLVGDDWALRGSAPTGDGPPNRDCQVTLINTRFCALIEPNQDRRPLMGDQLHVDFDLSAANVPVGTFLAVGEAVLEVTAEPHPGCGKFVRRFGLDAARIANSPAGRDLRLRGVNTRVVVGGFIRPADSVRKTQ